jgi:hypothetical protein
MMKSFWAAVTTAARVATGCGGNEDGSRSRAAAVTVADYVASPTLGRGSSERLFAIPGLGQFRAACVRTGEARIAYRAARGGAGQSAAVQTARATRPAVSLDPGDRVAAAIDRDRAPRVDWQVGILSEGRVDVLTASVTVDSLGAEFGCFLTAKAHRANRLR